MKLYLSVLLFVVCMVALFLAIVFNPLDKQYISCFDEMKGLSALKNNDINAFFEFYDKPVTVKNHVGAMLLLSNIYKDTGRYIDALRVIISFRHNKDYSVCATFNKPLERSVCRIINVFEPDLSNVDKNREISKIYFEMEDFKRAIEYNLLSNNVDYCYSAKLYANTSNSKKVDYYLLNCRNKEGIQSKKYRLAYAYVNSQKSRYLNAEACYKSLINKNCEKRRNCSYNNDVYMGLADLYMQQKIYKKAERYYKKVLYTKPYSYKANFALAQCLIALHKSNEAKTILKNIILYNPDSKYEIEILLKKISSNN